MGNSGGGNILDHIQDTNFHGSMKSPVSKPKKLGTGTKYDTTPLDFGSFIAQNLTNTYLIAQTSTETKIQLTSFYEANA
jgi:hypothetical protein